MGFQRQVHYLFKVVPIDVSENAEDLTSNILAVFQKSWREHPASLCRENQLVVDLAIDPYQNIVDVGARGEVHHLPVAVNPEVVCVWTGVHRGKLLWSYIFANDAVKLVEVVEQLKDVERYPLAVVNVLG